VKLLVDMNLSPVWASYLVGEGFEAIHWTEVGEPRATDKEILAWARDHHHAVFTHDLDFSVLLALAGDVGPSVVQVRTLELTPDGIGADVVRALREHADALARGAILTLDARSARVRVLPIHRNGERSD
jgi:predicted nuclease of predicted toxin-antitoxin system